MNIVIEVTSFQRLAPEQNSKKIFNSIGGTIGRVAHADLLLLDHDKVISKVHARIDCEQGTYYISDTSTNGVFVNDDIEPLGQDRRHALREGDKLRLGDYELTAGFTNEEPYVEEPIVVDYHESFEDAMQSTSENDVIPMSTDPSSVRQKVVHEAQEQDAFQPPNARLPENWNYDEGEPSEPEAAPEEEVSIVEYEPEEESIVVETPEIEEFSELVEDVVVAEEKSPEPKSKPKPKPKPEPKVAQKIPDPVPAEPQERKVTQAELISQQAPLQAVTMSEADDEYVQSEGQHMIDIVPFLNGLGLGVDNKEALRPSVMFELGKTLRDLLSGMLETMSARAELKSEFRVMQTTIRSQENNPIKFSVDTNEMIQNLFFRNLKSFLKPKDAIAEAFKDLNAHEIALMAGVQSAVTGILEELDPNLIKQKPYAATGFGKLLPGKQNERYWQIYTNYYQEIRRSIAEGNNRFIDIDFAKAYEDKLNELK